MAQIFLPKLRASWTEGPEAYPCPIQEMLSLGYPRRDDPLSGPKVNQTKGAQWHGSTPSMEQSTLDGRDEPQMPDFGDAKDGRLAPISACIENSMLFLMAVT